MALITNCDKSQIATAGIPELSQFVTVPICHGSKHTSQIYINSTRGYTPKYRKHVYILIGQFQEGFLFASFMDLITDIHRNRYTIKKTPKWAKITNCNNSRIPAVAIYDLSQFVIKALMWHIDSNNTENVFWVLGRVPRFTFDMNMKICIFVHFLCYFTGIYVYVYVYQL